MAQVLAPWERFDVSQPPLIVRWLGYEMRALAMPLTCDQLTDGPRLVADARIRRCRHDFVAPVRWCCIAHRSCMTAHTRSRRWKSTSLLGRHDSVEQGVQRGTGKQRNSEYQPEKDSRRSYQWHERSVSLQLKVLVCEIPWHRYRRNSVISVSSSHGRPLLISLHFQTPYSPLRIRQDLWWRVPAADMT